MNDQPDSIRTFALAEMPGEIVLRYRPSLPIDASLSYSWRSSKNRWWLFALGGLWLLAGIASSSFFIVASWFYSVALIAIGSVNLSLIQIIEFIAVMPIIMMVWTLVYSILLLACLVGTPGLNWLEAIMGPTHIGLSSSGIKLNIIRFTF